MCLVGARSSHPSAAVFPEEAAMVAAAPAQVEPEPAPATSAAAIASAAVAPVGLPAAAGPAAAEAAWAAWFGRTTWPLAATASCSQTSRR